MFLYWKKDLLHIFNIVKNMTHDLIRGMFKIMMQSLKVQLSCYKAYKIGNIMLENASSYNLDVAPEVRGSQQDRITRLITKSETTFVAFHFQSRLKNLFSREKTHLHTRNIIYWPYIATLVVSFSGSKIMFNQNSAKSNHKQQYF